MGCHSSSFNPRARAGRDREKIGITEEQKKFQSTRPRGARPVLRWAASLHPVVSIHAPARGATSDGSQGQRRDAVSIHAPARGATRIFTRLSRDRTCFNPRARAGRDTDPHYVSSLVRSFNPRARAGRDVDPIYTLRDVCSFNPRARAGRDPSYSNCSSAKRFLACLREPHNPIEEQGPFRINAGKTSLFSHPLPSRDPSAVFMGTPVSR